MLALIVSPEASRTPVAAPSLTRISSTSACSGISPPCRLDQVDEAADQRAHPAHGVMHAELLLEIGDHAVDRTRPERVAADQQRMEAERRPQALVARNISIRPRRRCGSPSSRRRSGATRAMSMSELNGASPSRLEAEAIDLLAALQEPLESGDVAWIESAPPRRAWPPGRRSRETSSRRRSGCRRRARSDAGRCRPASAARTSAHNSSNRNGAVTIVGPASKVNPSCRNW